MPNNLKPAAPADVLPAGLCAAFTEELRIEAYLNAYLDGSSDRFALALNPRRFFKLTRKLLPTEYDAFWTFYRAHLIQPFYFYNGVETVPPFSSDATGSNPVGRYIVTFDGSWSEAVAIARSQVSFGLREVA